MKLRNLLLISLLILTASGLFAQDKWEKLCEESPKTALSEAEKMYSTALKEHNSPLLIQALIIKIRCKTLINAGDFPQMLKDLENLIRQNDNPVEKSILNSLCAELYQCYYSNSSWTINQRTALSGIIPEDMEEWSGNLFIEKIFSHTLASLTPAEILQQQDIDTYKEILIPGKDSQALRPTVYDFLAHRSIAILSSCREAERFFKQQPIADILSLYGNLNTFIQEKLSVYPYNVNSNILDIYQKLLSFRKEAGQPDALLIADLNRLNYVRSLSDNTDLYLKALEEMQAKFQNLPYSVEIINEIARHYINQSYRNKNQAETANLLKKALALCESGIRQYPNYTRIDLLKEQVQSIKAPGLSLGFSNNVYPGKDQQLQITYKNIKDYRIEIFKVEGASLNYLSNRGNNKVYENHPHTPVWSQNFHPAESITNRNTTLSIPIGKAGLYEVVVSSGEAKTVREYFISTKLAATSQRISSSDCEFLIRDRISGRPVERIRIDLYDYINGQYQLKGTVYTDKYGIASSSGKIKAGSYTITDVTNPVSLQNDIPYYFNSAPAANKGISLFTDRKIYRPGQQVFFSGISWFADPDTSYAQTGKNYEVALYDVNHQFIDQKKGKTNQFGSFSGDFLIPQGGLNGNYSIRVNQDIWYNINVADYQRPKFEIKISPAEKNYYFGDTVIIKGQVKSYSGVDQSDSQVSYDISLQSIYRWSNNVIPVNQGVIRTDSKGNFEIRFVAAAPEKQIMPYRTPYYYQVSVTATNNNGETQEATSRISISERNDKLSIHMPDKINRNDTAIIRFSTTARQKEKLFYTISRLAPLNSLNEQYHTDSAKIEKMMQQGIVSAIDYTLKPDFRNYTPGAYMIEIRNAAENQTNLVAKTIFYIYSPQDKRPPLLTYNWLISEKTECLPGETAKILLGTSARDVYVLYDIYSYNKRIKRERLILSNENKLIEILYKKEYGGEICVVISYIKDEQYFENIVRIKLLTPEKDLIVKTEVFRDKLTPGQQENWKLSVLNYKGKGRIAEIMAVLYDASLDALAPNKWYFKPDYIFNLPYTNWQQAMLAGKNRLYINFPAGPRWDIPPFRFDALNLLGIPNSLINIMDYGSDEMFEAAPTGKSRAIYQMNSHAKMEVAADAAGVTAEEGQPIDIAQSIRQNFQETAFFYPLLESDSNGLFTIHFTVPEAMTRWKFMALAHTTDLATGFIEKEITTSKDFMVNPLIPRFFRNGDSTILKTTINNLTANRQNGKITFELFNPSDNHIFLQQTKTFDVAGESNQTIGFSFTVPQDPGVIGCRIVAGNERFSDGEQHLVPVVSNRIMLTEALPFFSTSQGTHTYQLTNHSTTKEDFRLTLEVTANPVWYAVLSLPGLMEAQSENVTDISAAYYVNTVAAFIARSNPKIVAAIKTWKDNPESRETLRSQLEKNSELKAILLAETPWVLDAQNETERIQSLSLLLDPNRLNYLQAQAIKKLTELQGNEGGWSWFKGMYPSRFMTLNVLAIMAKANLTGQHQSDEQEKMMQIKALRYLDNTIKKDFALKTSKDRITYDQLLYLYVRSMYRDIPFGDALDAHKHYMSLAQKQWTGFTLYEKGITATTMWHYGFRETATRILQSLREYATTNAEMGMFWANNNTGYHSNSAVMTQTVILEAFYEIEGNIPELNLMKQWLLRQKQTQSWGNVPSTVDAVYILLRTGKNLLSEAEHLAIQVGNQDVKASKTDDILGYIKKSWNAAEITADMTHVKITKITDNPTWGGLYLQYFDKLDQVQKIKGSILNVEKKLFIEKNNENGAELIPLDKETLNIGDKVIVRLTLMLDRDMEYLFLQDLRAACFEPAQQLSGLEWKFGSVYYQETTDVTTNFFFNSLGKGTYVLEYPVWVNQAGEFQDGIATFQCIYAPEFISHSIAGKLQVKE